jgi:hypothetical protein
VFSSKDGSSPRGGHEVIRDLDLKSITCHLLSGRPARDARAASERRQAAVIATQTQRRFIAKSLISDWSHGGQRRGSIT